jgi:hypothetical protein
LENYRNFPVTGDETSTLVEKEGFATMLYQTRYLVRKSIAGLL